MKHFKLFFALFAMLALGVGNAWGAEKTYTFTSKSWGDSESAWTSNKDGGQLTSERGVQVSKTYTDASATSKNEFNNVSRVVVVYSTNASKGAGTINMQIGSNAQKSFTVTSSGGTTDRNAEFSFSPAESGKVKLIINCTTNSIYVKSITIETSESGGEDPGTGGQDPTPEPGSQQTITIKYNSTFTPTLPTASDSVNTTSTAHTVEGISVKEQGIYKGASNNYLMFAQNKGFLYNTESLGTINSIKVSYSSGVSTTAKAGVYFGSTEQSTYTITSNKTIAGQSQSDTWTNTTSGNGYFQLSTSNKNTQITEIVITYTPLNTGGGETPEPETPATELTDAQFAWSAATAEATMGASNTFPDLTNTLPVTVTYESSNTDAATIAADGTITLVAPGTTTISATFAGGEVSGTTYAPKTVSYTLTVHKAPATPTSTVYVKVTSTAGITDGEYLIVYEDAEGNPKAPVAFDGSLAPVKLDVASNNIEVSIASNTIAGNTDIDDATFTINTTAGTIQTKDGYYIGQTSNANGLATSTTTEYTNTISIENDGSATIISSGRAYLRYNSANDNLRFRYFKSSTYTAQKAIALYKKVDPSEILAPAFSVAAGSFYDAQSVEITCATAGAEIYYTLDGSTPSNASTKYTGAIAINETKTLKAIAIKGEYSSSVTEATYTILAPLATMQEIFDKATAVGSTATPVKVTMNNWVVTGVNGSNAYLTDGTKGLIIYTASHGFVVGDVLSGTVACDVKLYNGSAQLEKLTKLTEGLTVTTGGTITPVEVSDVTTLSGVNTGAVVKITGTCTQESSRYYVAGVQLYNSLFEFTNPTVGKKYNVTGVYLQYNTTQEILPRQQEDIEEIVDALPSATISIANITMEVGEEKTIEATITPVDAPITYETTATCITLNGTTITAVSEGTATITATIAGKAGEYTGVTKTFTVTVNAPNIATLPFEFNNGKADIENTLGMSQNGLGSDYGSAPLLKFDGTGDYVIIHFNGEPRKLSYDIKGNSYRGGTFTVQESEDGSAYTNIVEYTELGSTETKTHTLAATSRYVKFIYTEKVDGNVALGNIKIALPEEEPGEGGGETPEERLTDWVLTPLADITTNDLVVITMTKGETTWAMTNDKGTTAPVASVVTLSADALAAEPDANLKWVVSNDNGTLTIYPYGGYETWLYCTNANNGVRVGTGDAKEFTIDANYLYTSQTTDPRHIGVYNEQDWRCYKPSSGAIATNIADQTLAFYVKKNANDVLPGTGEDPEGGEGGEDPVVPTPTINATATFIFNTAEGLNDLCIAYPTTEDEDNVGTYKTNLTDGASFTQDGITMTSTDGTTVTRVWLTAAGKLDLRVYKGATLTFSVPAEHKISAIVFDGSNIGHLLVNGNAVIGNAWTGSEQTVTFTAKADASTIKINTIAFVVEYTRDVTNGEWGTICLPYASSSVTGATFYEVSSLVYGEGLWLDQLADGDQLVAGKPYIFQATANEIAVTYTGEAVGTPIPGVNGLTGTFTEIAANGDLVGNYIIAENKVWVAGTNATLPANRAYIANTVPTTPQAQIPGRRRVIMGAEDEGTSTGFENITTTDKAVKIIENGQLIIIRNGEKFNAQGVKF